MPQTIAEQIQDGMAFWEKKVGLKPNVCYLGKYEAEQWDRECNKPDLVIGDAVQKHTVSLYKPQPIGITVIDVIIHRVTDRSYMGFGV